MKYVKVFGDMGAYLGMYSNDYTQKDMELEKVMDGARLHCLYLIQDFPEGCKANCSFCIQGQGSRNINKEAYLINSYLIKYPMKKIIALLKDGFLQYKGIRRVCFSAVYHEQTNEDLLEIFKEIRTVSDVSLTACCIPDSKETLIAIKEAGADRVVINYETCTEHLFETHRGKMRKDSPYSWEKINQSIENALEVFGANNVGTHLIIGLGENHEEALSFIQWLFDKGIDVSLFAFRPVPNTDLENLGQVPYADFHKIQTARYIIRQCKARFEDMRFSPQGEILDYGIDRSILTAIVNSGKPYRNMGGCPNCNRINYDNAMKERPYTFPRELHPNEIDLIRLDVLGIEHK